MLRFSLVLRVAPRALSLGRHLSSPVPEHFSLIRPAHLNTVPAPHFASRCIHSSRPSNGVTDSLRNAYGAAFSGAEEKREQNIFEVQMKFLSDKERAIDGDIFLEILLDMKAASGMGGLKENLPWVRSNPALQEFKDQELILCSMTPAERRNISLVRIAAKKRIASTSNLPLKSVEAVLDQIDMMSSIQKWMLKRIEAALPLPQNSKELQNMLSAPGSGMRKKASPNRRMPNPGIGKKLRRR